MAMFTHLSDPVSYELTTRRCIEVGNPSFPSPRPVCPRAGLPCGHWLLIHLAKPVLVALHQFITLVFLVETLHYVYTITCTYDIY